MFPEILAFHKRLMQGPLTLSGILRFSQRWTIDAYSGVTDPAKLPINATVQGWCLTGGGWLTFPSSREESDISAET